MIRRRAWFAGLALCTIGLGLLVHFQGEALGPGARDVIGDALWAAMIAWCVGALAPAAGLGLRSMIAYGVCAGVEVSQLYHTPMLDTLRGSVLGHLVLGSDFDVRDLAAYAVAVACAALLEAVVAARGRPAFH